MRLGAYELLDEIGRGGLGVVFKARDPEGRVVALKVIANPDAATAGRFEREGRLLASLGSAHGFVPLLDAGRSDDRIWIAMPLLEGGTLRDRLRGGPLPVAEALALGRALAAAAGAAHERGIVHRDLKPENVLFGADGRALVSDLGLARHFRRDAPGAGQSRSLTGAGIMAGTLGYMAPEQIDDAHAAGPAADVFALGAIVYELLAGVPPFETESLLRFVEQANTGVMRPLSAMRPDAPRWIGPVVARALAADPARRYRDARELGRALAGAERAGGSRRVLAGGVALAALAVLAATIAAVVFARGGAPSVSTPPLAAKARPVALVRSATPARRPAPPDAGKLLAADLFEKWLAHRHAVGDRESLAELGAVLEADPDLVEAWVRRATVRHRLSDYEGARSDTTRALELSSDHAEALGVRGGARRMLGDYPGAIEDCTRALQLTPHRAAVWGDLGAARYDSGQYEEALEPLGRALQLAPDASWLWATRGYALAQLGRYPAAIADYTRAIELDPVSVEPWLRRGMAHAMLRDAAKSRADLSRVLELAPEGSEQRVHAVELLRRLSR